MVYWQRSGLAPPWHRDDWQVTDADVAARSWTGVASSAAGRGENEVATRIPSAIEKGQGLVIVAGNAGASPDTTAGLSSNMALEESKRDVR